MSCTKHLMNAHWEHHSWHRVVTSTVSLEAPETDMWGRALTSEVVGCRTQEICEVCGQMRAAKDCLCDTEEAARCAIRLAHLESSQQPRA